ncbi:hypothetical protein B5M09_001885 [Aphanomyces astaci]|uniref:protein-tyrosine-phosphatase n=1 Tax=Aphanomyces astaci TaxID=112090 RepID=A0A425D976_APHAT|nr:hypothetical protein B5M09_001885 [Aphanomyces astaci]
MTSKQEACTYPCIDQTPASAHAPCLDVPVVTPVHVFNFLQHSASRSIVLDISKSFDKPPKMVLAVSFSTDDSTARSCEFDQETAARLTDVRLTHVFVMGNPSSPHFHQDLSVVYARLLDTRGTVPPALCIQYVDAAILVDMFPLVEPPLVSLIETSRGWIFLGNNLHAQNDKVVNDLAIRSIVNCSSTIQERTFSHVDYYDVTVSTENPEESTFKAFDEAVAYMESAQSRVLVHSTYGRSRCCTLVVYFLMKTENMSLVDAYHRVLSSRPNMMPRDAILDILLQKERFLFGTSSFDDEDGRNRCKHMTRGGLLSREGQARLTAAISNIHDTEVRHLAAKNKPIHHPAVIHESPTARLSSKSKRTVPESSVTCRWLFNRLQSGTGMLLLDARSRADFDDNCIPTAISIPATHTATLDAVENALLPEQAHLFTAKKRKLREVQTVVVRALSFLSLLECISNNASMIQVVIYGYAVKVSLKELKPWMYVVGSLVVAEGLVSSVRYLEDGFTTFHFRYPFYTSQFLFANTIDDDDDRHHHHLLARTQSGTHNVNYPNEILDGFLYLGNMWHAQSPSVVRNLGITHIVNASLDTTNVFDKAGVLYLEVKIKDDIHANIGAYFEPTYRFIEAAKQVLTLLFGSYPIFGLW